MAGVVYFDAFLYRDISERGVEFVEDLVLACEELRRVSSNNSRC
jgi:predicted DNA-binding protein